MIFDKMERLAQYKGMNANLDKLIDFVLNNSFDALQPGRNEIDGENCWLNNNVAPLQAQTDLYERHMDYIDLQIPIGDAHNCGISKAGVQQVRKLVGKARIL